MNTLILNPTPRNLSFALFDGAGDTPILESSIPMDRFDRSISPCPEGLFQQLNRELAATPACACPDLIGVRGIHGGGEFPLPVLWNDAVHARLAARAHQAPLHLPPLLAFLRALAPRFPGIPIILTFETAFFDALPTREHLYALAPAGAQTDSFRRFGFKGLFHEAACEEASHCLRLRLPRMISLCLEPRPELAAVIGRRPVMVTGGATPFEGLPGETSCGDLDPSVALKLAHQSGGGPEETGRMLGRESGLGALAGRPVTLPEVLESEDAGLRLVRDVFHHQVLRACGAAIAAMGGLDAIVFSGRYARSGHSLDAWLRPRLVEATRTAYRPFTCPLSLLQAINRQIRAPLNSALRPPLTPDPLPADVHSPAPVRR